uniref:MFS domain-containing protein n=1 Tax=Caenorhabditis japonica TaxID=281687 RepID=A0A8R1HHB5_CAEJA
MNGLVLGVKGLLSFLSAPLVGALSDVWGRKAFLILTVLCTCMPIPCLKISPWWYFSLFSLSGLFSVTFSVILAYVADITDKNERSSAYGLVSATFAASLVTSPALGAYLSELYGDGLVVLLATIVAVADVIFIVIFVPESLPSRRATAAGAGQITPNEVFNWHSADPFGSLRIVWEDKLRFLLKMLENNHFYAIFTVSAHGKHVTDKESENLAGFGLGVRNTTRRDAYRGRRASEEEEGEEASGKGKKMNRYVEMSDIRSDTASGLIDVVPQKLEQFKNGGGPVGHALFLGRGHVVS